MTDPKDPLGLLKKLADTQTQNGNGISAETKESTDDPLGLLAALKKKGNTVSPISKNGGSAPTSTASENPSSPDTKPSAESTTDKVDINSLSKEDRDLIKSHENDKSGWTGEGLSDDFWNKYGKSIKPETGEIGGITSVTKSTIKSAIPKKHATDTSLWDKLKTDIPEIGMLDAAVRTAAGVFADQVPQEFKTEDLRLSKGTMEDALDAKAPINSSGFKSSVITPAMQDEYYKWNNKQPYQTRSKPNSEKASLFLKQKFGDQYATKKEQFGTEIGNYRSSLEKDVQSQKNEFADKTKGIPQDIMQVTGDNIGAFVGNLVGQAIGRIPSSVASAGGASFIAERAAVFDSQIDKLSKKTGMSREEILKKGLDHPESGRVLADFLALTDVASLGNILGSSGKKFTKKVVNTLLEAGQEVAQGEGEEYGAAKGSGTKYEPSASRMVTGGLGGLVGGIVLGGASENIENKSPDQITAESSEGIDSNNLAKVDDIADKIQASVNQTVGNFNPVADAQAVKETPVVQAQNLDAKPEETPISTTDGEERRQGGEGRQDVLTSPEDQAGVEAPAVSEYQVGDDTSSGKKISAITKKDGDKIWVEFEGGGKGLINAVKPTIQKQTTEEVNAQQTDQSPSTFLEKYNDDSNYGISDLVDDIESIADENPNLNEAVKKYREEQAHDIKISGRNDMTAAEDNFIHDVEKVISNEQPTQPTTTGIPGQQPLSGPENTSAEQHPIADVTNVTDNTGLQETSDQPVQNGSSGEATPSGQPIYNNSAIYTGDTEQTRANIIPELSEEGKVITTISNDLTTNEAKRIVKSTPLAQVEQVTFDQTNDMQPALRRVTALELAKEYRARGDREAAQRVFDKYRGLGTEAAQALQAGIIAANDPLIQTMMIVSENNDEVDNIRKEVQPDGQTTGKKLDTTRKEIDGLAAKFGVEVSESESLDTLLTKILAKGIPKSERLNIARKRVKDSGNELKNAVASMLENMNTRHLVLDPENKSHTKIFKVLTNFITAVVNETVLEVGEKAADLSAKIIAKVKNFIKGIGFEVKDADLNKMVADQIGEQPTSRYTPPITEFERISAVNKIKDLFLKPTGNGKTLSPAIQEFYSRMVKRIASVPGVKSKSVDPLIEVTQNLDKYADVLQGVKDEMQSEGIDVSDVNSIFDLPYFEKQIQNKVLIADIKNLVKQHYSVQQGVNESIAQQLISQYNLSGNDAETVQRLVNAEFAAKMKIATDAELTKLYGSSKLKKPKVNPKTDADKIIEALNMGVFDDEMYSQLVAQKFGIYEFTKEDVQQFDNFAERMTSLPKGELRNKAISQLNTYLENLKDKNMASKIYAGVKGLWVTSALSGPTTTARMIKGGFLTAPLHITQAMAANLRATTTSFRALNALYRGFQSGGGGTFMHMLKTGDNPFGGTDARAEGYWDKIRNTSFRKIINSDKTSTKKAVDTAAKTWSQLLFYPVNFAAGIETVLFRYPIKELESYYHVYNQMVEGGMSPKEKDFWKKLDQNLAVDPISIDAAEAQLEEELATNKEKLTQGYDKRRLQEIIDSKRDENTVKYSIEKANSAALMNNPGGLGGAFVRSVKTLGGVKDGVSAPEAVFRFLMTLPFTFARVAVNQINSSVQYFPIAGYLYNRSNTIWEKGNINQKIERPKTADEKRRVIAAQIMGTMVTGALLTTLFNWEWDDDDDKLLPTPSINEDSKIQVTGLGLGATKYQENRDIDPNYKEMSLRWRYSDGSYSDWYSYRDSPLGIVLYGFGQMSDEMRFKDFKKKTDETERSTNALLLTIANQAWNFAVSQSFQQGIKNILDVMSFEGTDSGMDKAMKAIVSPVKPLLFPNLYKQTYQQLQAYLDVPDAKARTIPEQLTKDIPLVDGYVQGDRYDQLGYPMIRKFEVPLVPDYLLNALKENRDYRETKKEWKLVFKYPEVTLGNRFHAPEELKKEDMFGLDRIFKRKPEFIKLTKEQKDTYEKDAGIYLRELINQNYNRLNVLVAEDLQTELNTLKTRAVQKAKSDIVGRSLRKNTNDMKRDLTSSFE